MKKFLKILGKLVLVALILLLTNVIISYVLEVSYTSLLDGTDTYYFKTGLLSNLYVMLVSYFFIGGWAYLLAASIYHFSLKTDLFQNKFKFIIGLAFLFYLFITYRFYGISLILISYFIVVSIIYYGLVKREVFGEYIRETGLWYVIFLLFFFFYWLSSSLEPKMLILQLIVYIPLAWIGQKVYAKLFVENKINLAKD